MSCLPASVPVVNVAEDFKYPEYSSAMSTYADNPDNYTTLFDQSQIGISFEGDLSLTVSRKQKFTIREISPEWGYTSEATKVILEITKSTCHHYTTHLVILDYLIFPAIHIFCDTSTTAVFMVYFLKSVM